MNRRDRGVPRAWTMVGVVSVVTLALDRLSKELVIEWLGCDAASHRWEVAGRFLAFEYVENTGAAFGLLAGRVWILSLLALVVSAAFAFLLRDAIRHRLPPRVALGLLVGGAAGNVFDRARLGHVTDFLALGVWPKFNLADTAITVGLGMIAWYLLRQDANEGRSASS